MAVLTRSCYQVTIWSQYRSSPASFPALALAVFTWIFIPAWGYFCLPLQLELPPPVLLTLVHVQLLHLVESLLGLFSRTSLATESSCWDRHQFLFGFAAIRQSSSQLCVDACRWILVLLLSHRIKGSTFPYSPCASLVVSLSHTWDVRWNVCETVRLILVVGVSLVTFRASIFVFHCDFRLLTWFRRPIAFRYLCGLGRVRRETHWINLGYMPSFWWGILVSSHSPPSGRLLWSFTKCYELTIVNGK
jgi:hypothetical protein